MSCERGLQEMTQEYGLFKIMSLNVLEYDDGDNNNCQLNGIRDRERAKEIA